LGEINSFKKHKLIVGVLSVLRDREDEVINTLSEEFGKVDYKSENLPFTYTSYYDREMGPNIERFFLSFEKLISPEKISDVKIHTNYLERFFSIQEAGKGAMRKVNFDPGLLNLSHLILASSKDNVHRIPLKEGIYGEVTLAYKEGTFEPFPWTYIDYKSPEYTNIFSEIREIYKKDI
jgi:uncharacterized protein DUF4416